MKQLDGAHYGTSLIQIGGVEDKISSSNGEILVPRAAPHGSEGRIYSIDSHRDQRGVGHEVAEIAMPRSPRIPL